MSINKCPACSHPNTEHDTRCCFCRGKLSANTSLNEKQNNTQTKIRVLVVDDEEQLRDLISMILSNADYEVFSAESGKEALAILEQHHVDMIMTDIMMPDMNGAEFINKVKREMKLTVKIIAMSGNGSGSTHLNLALEMGADEVMEKPFSVVQLLETVKQVIEKNAYATLG